MTALLLTLLLAQPASIGGLGPPMRVNVVQPTDGGRPVSVSSAQGKSRDGGTTWPVEAPYSVQVSDPMQSAALTGRWNGKYAMPVYVLGKRTQGWSSTTALEDCVQYLDTGQPRYNEGSASEALWIRSSSDLDNNDGGTGIRTMRVVAVMADGGQEARTYSLEGTVGVFMDAGFAALQWMEAATVGTNTVAVGNVSVATTSGAPTVAQIREYVAAGGNRSLSGRYRVPSGHSAYLESWNVTNIGAATMDTRLRMTSFSDDSTIAPGAYHFVDTAYLSSATNYQSTIPWVKVPGGADIKVSTTTSNTSGTNRLDCSIHLLLVKD